VSRRYSIWKLDKARVAAVEDARRKADMMVKTAGGKVGFLQYLEAGDTVKLAQLS